VIISFYTKGDPFFMPFSPGGNFFSCSVQSMISSIFTSKNEGKFFWQVSQSFAGQVIADSAISSSKTFNSV